MSNKCKLIARCIVAALGISLFTIHFLFADNSNPYILLSAWALVLIGVLPLYKLEKTLKFKCKDTYNSSLDINTDAPIKSKFQDELGHLADASILESQISSFSDEGSRVVALEGTRGNGKTSVINLMLQKIKESNNPNKGRKSKSDEVKVVFFVPWFYGKDTKLIEQLVNELLKLNDLATRTQFKKLSNLLRVANSINPEAVTQKIFNFFMDQTDDGYTLRDQLQSIKESLANTKQKTLIIIDDVDRLQPDQILEVCQMIKSVLDLPYVNFCISYDKAAVSSSFPKVMDISSYLEKIVQDTHHLLEPDINLIFNFFTKRIQNVYEQIVLDQTLRNRWADVVVDLQQLITTPRGAKKLAYNINFAFKSIGSEVDAVQLICIETIKMYNNGLFKMIYKNKFLLTDHSHAGGTDLKLFDMQLKECANNQPIINILYNLFPILRS